MDIAKHLINGRIQLICFQYITIFHLVDFNLSLRPPQERSELLDLTRDRGVLRIETCVPGARLHALSMDFPHLCVIYPNLPSIFF